MSKRRTKTTVHTSGICHHCKNPISIDAAAHSQRWAYGIVGVRWLVCSMKCARLADAA